MSDMQGRAPPTTEERHKGKRTSDTETGARPSNEEATFILHILTQTRESGTSEVDWDKTAAAAGLPSTAAAHGKYGDLQTRMGWRIPQDAQIDQPTDKRKPMAKVPTKASIKTEAEDSDSDNSEGGVKLDMKKGAEENDTEDSDGGVGIDTERETERPAGEDWLLTKEFQMPTMHPASRRPTRGRPWLQ